MKGAASFRRLLGIVLIAWSVTNCSVSSSAEAVAFREAYARPGDRAILVHPSTCNADLESQVEESTTEIVITVLARNQTGDDCLDSVIIDLDDVLGTRSLIDGSSGTPVDVQDPMPTPSTETDSQDPGS